MIKDPDQQSNFEMHSSFHSGLLNHLLQNSVKTMKTQFLCKGLVGRRRVEGALLHHRLKAPKAPDALVKL